MHLKVVLGVGCRGLMAMALDYSAKGLGFKSHPRILFLCKFLYWIKKEEEAAEKPNALPNLTTRREREQG